MELLEQKGRPKMCLDQSDWFDANALSGYQYDAAGGAADAAAMLHAQFDLWPPFSSAADGFLSAAEGSADTDRQERMMPVHWAMDEDYEVNATTAANDHAAQDARFERCFQQQLGLREDSKTANDSDHSHCLGLAPHCGVAFIQMDQDSTVGMLSSWYKRWLVLDFSIGSLMIYKHSDQHTQYGALDLRTVRAIKRTSRLDLSIEFIDAAQSSLLLRCQEASQAELWVTLLRLAQQLIETSRTLDPAEPKTQPSDNSMKVNDTTDEDLVNRQLMKLQLETAAS